MRKWLILLLALAVIAVGAFYLGTRLQSSGPPGPTTQASGPSITPPAEPVKNPFGVLVSPRNFDLETRIRISQDLGVRYFRSFPALVPTWNGECSECDAVHQAGLEFVLSIRNTPSEMSAASPVSDVAAFKRTVGEILDQYKPALAVAENEEDVTRYWSGTPDQYIAELEAVCEVAHQHDTKCANGGITYTGATWLTYNHYLETGETDKAESFAQRGLDKSQQGRLSSPQGLQAMQQVVDHEMSLVSRYKDAGVDYVNIHWYQADAQAFEETVRYIKQLTGLPVITNEIGEKFIPDPNVVTGLLAAVLDLKLPMAVWFSADIGFARGLVNPDGSLRPNGMAFAEFVHQHTR